MKKRMTKPQLMEILGFKKQNELAEYYDISEAAVSLWPDDKPVPELRELQARERNPEKFSSAA